MELNWSTFVLEIINFLVLLLILKRFLYQPVLQIIARRQGAIQQGMIDAKTLREEAESVQKQYQNRLLDWQRERDEALASLQQEIASERGRLQNSLVIEMENEREKVRVLGEQQQQQTLHELEAVALAQGAKFAAQFLEPFASPALEDQLIDLTLEQLSTLSESALIEFKSTTDDFDPAIIVNSAFALSRTQCERIDIALKDVFGLSTAPQYVQDEGLIAGLRITSGAWVLKANLCDELAIFTQQSQRGGF